MIHKVRNKIIAFFLITFYLVFNFENFFFPSLHKCKIINNKKERSDTECHHGPEKN